MCPTGLFQRRGLFSRLVLFLLRLLVGVTSLGVTSLGVTSLGGCSDRATDGPNAGAVADAAADAGAADTAAADTSAAGDAGAADAAADDPDVRVCPPGLAGCVAGDRVACNAAGTAFVLEPCADNTVCSGGMCVACAVDDDCVSGEVCLASVCTTPALSITTDALPNALVGQAYSQQLAATGGVPPYTWKLDQGLLPLGLLVGSGGEVKGVATATAIASVSIAVTDSAKTSVSRIFVVEVKAGDSLLISTTSPLKNATEGKKYSLKLTATGGEKPYFWGLKSGKLAMGVTLGADGTISGTPTEDGAFTFDIKALDDGLPTLTATRTFTLSVGLAPLQIVGTQEVNLFVTKVIVLPLIVVVKGIPVPYTTSLQAQGGKKPYSWSEVPLPGAVKSFVPNAGLPKGLKLGKDGKINGSVTDPSLVVEVKIPLTKIVLKGFFFSAQVVDSQSPGKTKTAMFIVPTAPVNF